MASPDARTQGAAGNRCTHLEAGQQLAGRYRLQKRLGDGGHAEVWAAQDETAGELVALKFLHLHSCGAEEALPPLRHEAAMVQRLDHPGVLRVADPVRDGGLVFLPMEYASGGDAARLRGASWQVLLPVLLDVARVLEHAHSRGVVHRDIKPGNVLFGAAGQVKVADFGTSARTGCRDAPAPGSPFSASPQQLRDEPASTADDLYGLGALAYELLTLHPPFYPQFDARRVQVEDPPRAVPTRPAPEALLDVVQAMLAREAADRPDLATVMSRFAELMNSGPAEQAALVIAPEPVAAAAGSERERRGPPAWWWLAAAAAAGLAVLVLLPGPRGETLSAAAEPAPVISSVAEAVVGQASPAPEETPAAPADPAQTLAAALASGEQALAALQPAQARAAFERALVLDAGNAQAQAGLAATADLEALFAGLAEATRLEAAGQLAAARDSYQQLLARRAGFAPAQAGHARVSALLEEQRQLMLREREQVAVRERNAQDLATGSSLEQAERWAEAVTHYEQVLARDGSLSFASDGLARAIRRAALDAELADYLARPGRLTTPAVRRAAEQALARAMATAGEAPRLREQVSQLQATLARLEVQARVALSSDNNTLVSIDTLGDLGRFQNRELQLPPGHYTVTGRREGYRDVRHELEIAPGQQMAALSVQCTDPI